MKVPEYLELIINYSLVTAILLSLYVIIKSNKEYFFIEIAFFFALIQWLIAPAFIESLDIKYLEILQINNKNRVMDYFTYSISTVTILFLALFVFQKNKKNTIVHRVISKMKNEDQQNYNGFIGIRFLAIGVVMSLINSLFIIPVISVILGFMWNLIPIGLIYLLFSNTKQRYLFLAFGVLYLLILGVKSGLFFHTVIWTLILSIFFFLKHPVRSIIKIAVVLALLPVFAILQVSKTQFRAQTWTDKEVKESKSSILIREFNKSSKKMNFAKNADLALIPIAVRLNQAHIDAKVMKNIPKHKKFQNGATILKSFLSVFVPRPLWPNKYGYNNEKMITLANYKDAKNAFFTVSMQGEAYANFGYLGGGIFLVLYLFCLKWFYIKVLDTNYAGISMLFFTPAIFYTVIRTEIDFYQLFANLILNYIIFTSIAKIASIYMSKVIAGGRLQLNKNKF